MSRAPKSYEAKVFAALTTAKISHQEAVDCLNYDAVLSGSCILKPWGWEKIFALRALGAKGPTDE